MSLETLPHPSGSFVESCRVGQSQLLLKGRVRGRAGAPPPSTPTLTVTPNTQQHLIVRDFSQSLQLDYLQTVPLHRRMANGNVDDLAWSQLRPRRSDPQCVIDSIPPEDMQTFLSLMATNPFLPFNDASAVRTRISSLRQWRTDAANPNTVTKDFFSAKPSSKRRRDEPNGSANGFPDDSRFSDSDEEQPRRKNRRSARPTLSPLAQRAPPRGDSPQSDDAPKIGAEFQAEVPAAPLPKSHWNDRPIQILSERVYSEERLGGEGAVRVFLSSMNTKLRRRDGFPLAPYAMEVALRQLFVQNGNQSQALQHSLQLIPRGPFFPGIKGHFKYEEQCMFVRSLAERSKDFRQISREVLPHRSTSELVWLYYARHKQLWIQNGGIKNGLVLDDGGEKLKRVQLTTDRTMSSLRNLAVTAGDGFPIDSRVNLAVLACRRGKLTQQRKIRDEEAFRRMPRLRNQNAPS